MTPSARAATAYPWKALENVSREGARRGRRARQQWLTELDFTRLASALAELCGCDVSLVVRRLSASAPRRSPSGAFGFELADGSLTCALLVEPELVANLLGRVLCRPVTLAIPGALDASLSGAFSALVSEAVRRAGAHHLVHPLDAAEALSRTQELFLELTLLVAGSAYQLTLQLALADSRPDSPRSLAELGELVVAVPVVVGLGLARRAELVDFRPGNAWFPGAGLWLDPAGAGPVALAAATHDSGLSGLLSKDGKIVLRGERIALPFEPPEAKRERDEPMSNQEESDAPPLADAVLDSHIVVRVEMGAVSLSAREWAGLGPGDVIETGQRVAGPVILRVAGKEVARGELVNLEGELGVRIRELTR